MKMESFKDANLYSAFSDNQKSDAQFLFKEFVNKNQNQLKTCEHILDVGCGTGETLFDFMLPSLEAKCLKVTGVDVSIEMIKFAKEKYENVDRSFFVFDIQNDLENVDSQIQLGSFDLVILSYCYHWVQNEKSVLRNIHSFLKPGGLCFMIFPVNHIFYKVCVQKHEVEKFKPYVKLEDFVSRHFYSKNPVAELGDLLKVAGFKIQNLEIRRQNFTFPSVEHLESSFKAIIPFKMPEALKNEFVAESVQLMITMDDLNYVTADGGLNFSYELMVVSVSK